MRFGAIIFAILVFIGLFGVPVLQTFLENDDLIVFQESEEKDAEESEDVKLKDTIEELYFSNETINHLPFTISTDQLAHRSCFDVRTSQKNGVDTPPPEYS